MVHSFYRILCIALHWLLICICQYSRWGSLSDDDIPCLCPKVQKREKHAPIRTCDVLHVWNGWRFVITLPYRHLAGSHGLLQNMFPCCCRLCQAGNEPLSHSQCHWLMCRGSTCLPCTLLLLVNHTSSILTQGSTTSHEHPKERKKVVPLTSFRKDVYIWRCLFNWG